MGWLLGVVASVVVVVVIVVVVVVCAFAVVVVVVIVAVAVEGCDRAEGNTYRFNFNNCCTVYLNVVSNQFAADVCTK